MQPSGIGGVPAGGGSGGTCASPTCAGLARGSPRRDHPPHRMRNKMRVRKDEFRIRICRLQEYDDPVRIDRWGCGMSIRLWRGKKRNPPIPRFNFDRLLALFRKAPSAECPADKTANTCKNGRQHLRCVLEQIDDYDGQHQEQDKYGEAIPPEGNPIRMRIVL